MIPGRGGRFPKLGANGKMFGGVTRSFLLCGPSVMGSEVPRAGCGGMDPRMGQDEHGVGQRSGRLGAWFWSQLRPDFPYDTDKCLPFSEPRFPQMFKAGGAMSLYLPEH